MKHLQILKLIFLCLIMFVRKLLQQLIDFFKHLSVKPSEY